MWIPNRSGGKPIAFHCHHEDCDKPCILTFAPPLENHPSICPFDEDIEAEWEQFEA